MRTRQIKTLSLIIFAAFFLTACPKSSEEVDSTKTNESPETPTTDKKKTPPPKPMGKASLPGEGLMDGKPQQVGFILWGAELPLFYGNGGLQTRKGTIFAEHGVNLKLVPGDDFNQQLADYKAGKTVALRGTHGMIGKHAAELCKTPELCPVFTIQLTWSAGDHLVCRENVKEVSDLKGKTIAIQRNGPHEKFLLAVLKEDAGLQWSDVKLEWMDNITQAGSPPEMFRNNKKVDCAFAVTPDMIGITGGLTSKGDGGEGTIPGAKVLVSTSDRRRTIADVYAFAAGFVEKNPEWVRNFAVAYLKSMEKVIELRHAYEGSAGSPEFNGLLSFAVKTWTPEVLPNEEEAFGLYLDASFVGHAGNVKFFNPKSKDVGHKHFSDRSNDLAMLLGTGKERVEMRGSSLDWGHAVFKGLKSAQATAGQKFDTEATRSEIEALNKQGLLGDSTMLSFEAYFDKDQINFDSDRYGKEFDKVMEHTKSYSRAPIVIQGHTDSTRLVASILRAGIRNGQIKQAGQPGNYSYSINGSSLDLKNSGQILRLITKPEFNNGPKGTNPMDIARGAEDLSIQRAKSCRAALMTYAKSKGQPLDPSQIQVIGSGAKEPFIVKPRSEKEASQNRRVRFSIVRVSTEAATKNDFEL
jgi:ABC-type nitrate/sulfonate/bicarbonate transport system substrate-binding protein/outer membrane protein OmpA-like peptidoglycan-associated protein